MSPPNGIGFLRGGTDSVQGEGTGDDGPAEVLAGDEVLQLNQYVNFPLWLN